MKFSWEDNSYRSLIFLPVTCGICAFVILKDGVCDSGEETDQSLKQLVKRRLARLLHVPQLVMVCVMHLFSSHIAWANQ